ncbi:MAG: hypothetical protein ACOCV2_13395 [Persicimonas sp.]
MADEKTHNDKQALRDRIRALIASEFEEMNSDEVAEVLGAMARRLGRDSASDSPPERAADGGGWMNNITGGDSQPIEPTATSRSAEGYRVRLRVEEPSVVARALHQALEVGALLINFEEPPPLNEVVAVDLELPNSHLSIETQGRVVHASSAATAVEISQLGKEDRAALSTILEDYREHLTGPTPTDSDTRRAPAESADGTTQLKSGRTMQGRPKMRVARRDDRGAPGEAGSEGEEGGTVFDRHRNPSSSVVLGSLTPSETRRGFRVRREVELTTPDVQVLSSTRRILREDPWAGKAFGPEISWIEPTDDPDRVEELTGERIIDVLLQLSGSGFTGVLEIEADEVERQMYFDGGLAVEITRRPRQPHEELGPILHMADRIDDQQLAMAAAHADENGTTFERSLLELDILDHDRIRHAIAGRLTFLIGEVSAMRSGRIRVYASDALPAGYLPAPPLRVHVPVERIIYRRLFEKLRGLESNEREELIDEHLDTYPEVTAADHDRIERVVLSPEHGQLVQRIAAERRRLREVITESNLPPAETFAVIYALHRMGALRFDTSLHETIVRERFRENVTVKYLSVHKASYFEVLNVHWSSYDEVIERAYEELIEQFDPEQVPDEMEEEIHEKVGEIRDRIESAYEILAEREKRHGYRKRIMPEYKLKHAVPLFMKQAELAEKRSQFSEALDSLKRILEIDPDNEKAQLRYARIQEMEEGHLSPSAPESTF